MDPIIYTPRLKLTLVTTAERGSPELGWLHELRSNEETSWWSLHGRSKSLEETEKIIKGYMPRTSEDGEEKTYRVVYAVHKIIDDAMCGSALEGEGQRSEAQRGNMKTEFIGLINLKSLDLNDLPLPEHLSLPADAATTTLTVEVAYMFLPSGWGKGYATESIQAVFAASKTGGSFWTPFEKLYVRAIVNASNLASQRVMEKTEMAKRGVYEWSGKAIFMAGTWREKDTLIIYGRHLL